ncbi:hypothetical protein [Aurantimonas coralicida]|uniref:hypothetical protein n=1 Tax=Aurantimonas coralicida TaxID=182270 RepID=UPI001E405651|nr:hypothetical protein [Aurantimonas coralicida]MCD1645199.1 hypothetical protein [Aurantimonas coralicida]
MTIGLAILYGVAVMTAAFAAILSVGAFVSSFKKQQSDQERMASIGAWFVCGSVALSITIWLLGV